MIIIINVALFNQSILWFVVITGVISDRQPVQNARWISLLSTILISSCPLIISKVLLWPALEECLGLLLLLFLQLVHSLSDANLQGIWLLVHLVLRNLTVRWRSGCRSLLFTLLGVSDLKDRLCAWIMVKVVLLWVVISAIVERRQFFMLSSLLHARWLVLVATSTTSIWKLLLRWSILLGLQCLSLVVLIVVLISRTSNLEIF